MANVGTRRNLPIHRSFRIGGDVTESRTNHAGNSILRNEVREVPTSHVSRNASVFLCDRILEKHFLVGDRKFVPDESFLLKRLLALSRTRRRWFPFADLLVAIEPRVTGDHSQGARIDIHRDYLNRACRTILTILALNGARSKHHGLSPGTCSPYRETLSLRRNFAKADRGASPNSQRTVISIDEVLSLTGRLTD